MEPATAAVAPPVNGYRFVSRFLGNPPITWISIDVYKNGSADPIGRFEFQGSQAYSAPVGTVGTDTPKLVWGESTSFHFTGRVPATGNPFVMYCFQREAFQPNAAGDPSIKSFPYTSYLQDSKSTSNITIDGKTFPHCHTFSPLLLSTINTSICGPFLRSSEQI
jgi:hypothetical protein